MNFPGSSIGTDLEMRSDLLEALSTECRHQLQTVADRHEQSLLEEALRDRPDDFELLVRLGEIYPRIGQPQEGLRIDLKLVSLAPSDPIVRYNLACSLALTLQPQAAFSALREAIRLGYSDLEHLLADDDLASLREDPLFADILRLLRRNSRRVNPS